MATLESNRADDSDAEGMAPADVVVCGQSASGQAASLLLVARVVCGLLAVGIVAKLGVMLTYAQTMRWAMDEFAQGYCGRLLERGLYTNVDPIKTVLPYFGFNAALHWGASATEILQLWRLQSFLVALLMVGMAGLVAYRLYGNALLALLSAFSLLCFSNFIERAFRVRNDNFATLFGMASLLVIVHGRRKPWSIYLAGCLVGAAFLCTQKAVYLVGALAVGLLVIAWREGGALSHGARFAGGLGTSVLVYAFGFGGLGAGRVLRSILLSPLDYSSQLLSSDLWPELDQFVGQTLDRNLLLYVLSATGFAVLCITHRKRSAEQLGIAAAALVVTLAVFLHPQPWPYVFVMCLPFLALLLPMNLVLAPLRYQVLGAAALTAVLALSFLRNSAVLEHDNRAQFRVVEQVESMLGAQDHYFDGIGMIPNREVAGEYPFWWWDAPTIAFLRSQLMGGEIENAATIVNQQPKLWILNYRLSAFGDWTGGLLRFGTVRVDDLILVSGREIPAGKTIRFRNLWQGDYHVLGSDGRRRPGPLSVDGRVCPLPCKIPVGEHQVSVVDAEASFLLPSDVRPAKRLPVRGAAPDLFDAVYTF